jgi:RNA polymerase sigma factor (sigma-70 family)
MEASALNHTASTGLPALAGRSPLLRLQSDEKLIVLVRRGQHGAFEALVTRYQSRLLAFCRHMLGSTEDAEDVLQEVFAAAFNAMIADDRAINARPWLYRIARNRCLNHLRRPQHAGQDSMDVFERDGGLTTADAVYKREEFRQIVADVQDLPETQKTALLLREIDALSYDQIAEAMDTTVPSVKSLLVRARVSLAEAAEARLLTCDEVRLELGEVAEGLAKTTAPVRRHLKTCSRCRTFRGELRKANRALAAVYPLGPLIIFKKVFIGKLGLLSGSTAGGSGAGAGVAGGGAGAVAGAAAGAGGAGAGGFVSAGLSAVATKAAAGLAAAALATATVAEVKHVAQPDPEAQAARTPALIAAAPATQPVAPPAAVGHPQIAKVVPAVDPAAAKVKPEPVRDDKPAEPDPIVATPADPHAPAQPTAVTGQPQPPPVLVQEESSTVALEADGQTDYGSGRGSDTWDAPGEPPSSSGSNSGTTQSQSGSGAGSSGSTSPPPGESTAAPGSPTPAPVAGERPPGRKFMGRRAGSRRAR